MAAARFAGACLVVALVLFALHAAGRLWLRSSAAFEGRGRIVGVLETTMLPGAASIHVVRIAERYYAVARSGAAMTTLCEIPADGIPQRRIARGSVAFFTRFRSPRA